MFIWSGTEIQIHMESVRVQRNGNFWAYSAEKSSANILKYRTCVVLLTYEVGKFRINDVQLIQTFLHLHHARIVSTSLKLTKAKAVLLISHLLRNGYTFSSFLAEAFTLCIWRLLVSVQLKLFVLCHTWIASLYTILAIYIRGTWRYMDQANLESSLKLVNLQVRK